MEKILASTNPADPTVMAMKVVFISIVIIKFANITEVFPHVNTAIRTKFGSRLLCVAN
jgi:hypothetical protein